MAFGFLLRRGPAGHLGAGIPASRFTRREVRYGGQTMRLAIFSDVHANLEALSAVLEAYRREQIDVYYCLGDTVRLRRLPERVRNDCPGARLGDDSRQSRRGGVGPHGLLVLLRGSASRARRSRGGRDAENMAWLKSLPYDHPLTEHNVLLCHGSPVRLEEFEYIFAPEQARECLGIWDRFGHITLIGHSHLCKVFALTDTSVEELPSTDFVLEPHKKYIVSVESVGQPRDFDNRASYTVYDTDGSASSSSAEYDIELAADKVLRARLERNFPTASSSASSLARRQHPDGGFAWHLFVTVSHQ